MWLPLAFLPQLILPPIYLHYDDSSEAAATMELPTVRLVSGTAPWGHMSPVLKVLDCLPVSYQDLFIVLAVVYKVLNSSGPIYLKECIPQYQPSQAP